MALMQHVPAARPRSMAAREAPARQAYLDLLRTLVVAMVVVHHAAQPYGPTGGEWPIDNPTHAAILGPFFTVNAAFGLGLLFLIAGYFVPPAYDRKGGRRFLAARVVRLGLPLLFLALAVFLPMGYALGEPAQPFGSYLADYLRHPQVAHLWFVSYLILLSGGYVLWRGLVGPAVLAGSRPTGTPGDGAILSYAFGLAWLTFIVRIWFPIDRWVDVAPFVRLELAHVPQYLSLFIIGCLAYRRDWLRQLPTATGMRWLVVGLGAAALPYAATIVGELTTVQIDLGTDGGLSLLALASSVLEALIVVGLSVGLLTLFRERVDRPGPLLRKLASASYATYIIHIFPVIGLQALLAESALPPLAKFGLVSVLALPLCFLLGYGLHRLPGVRWVA